MKCEKCVTFKVVFNGTVCEHKTTEKVIQQNDLLYTGVIKCEKFPVFHIIKVYVI